MRFLPIMILLSVVFLFYYFFGFDFVSWNAIGKFQKLVNESLFEAILIFISVYIIYAMASIPGLLLLDVVAGIVFGQTIGLLLAWLSAATGATIVFLSVRYAFSNLRLEGKKHFIQRLEGGFNKHASNYLLFVRLVPCMPFGLINISLGILKVRPRLFIWTTLLGILPVSFFYTHAGAGISHMIRGEGPISAHLILNRSVVLSLIGLSVLALLPIIIKKKMK